MEWTLPDDGILINTMAGDDIGVDVNELNDGIFSDKMEEKSHLKEYSVKSGENKDKNQYVINFKL